MMNLTTCADPTLVLVAWYTTDGGRAKAHTEFYQAQALSQRWDGEKHVTDPVIAYRGRFRTLSEAIASGDWPKGAEVEILVAKSREHYLHDEARGVLDDMLEDAREALRDEPPPAHTA